MQRCFRLCCLYDTLLILHKYLHVFYISRISPETRVTFVCPSKCTSYIYLLYKSVNSFYLLCKCQCLPITRSSPCQIREQLGCIQIFQRCVRFPSRWSSIQHSWNVFMCARKHIFMNMSGCKTLSLKWSHVLHDGLFVGWRSLLAGYLSPDSAINITDFRDH